VAFIPPTPQSGSSSGEASGQRAARKGQWLKSGHTKRYIEHPTGNTF
jgi:hypothetical protein